MTQPPQARFGALPNGFFPDAGGPPPGHLPAKIGYRRRVKPACTMQLDAWLLQPETLRRIVTDLRWKAKTAGQARHFGQPDQQLADAAEALAGFLDQRRLYGERPSPWR